MQTMTFAELAGLVAQTGKIELETVLAARRAAYGNNGLVSLAAAEGLFEIERARTAHSPAWSMLFVEALTDFVLNQQPPVGYLSDANAAFVEGQVKRRKQPSTDCDVELVTKLIEDARTVPAGFAAFALRLVKDAVIYADGPDASGRPLGSGIVSDADVGLLQRILWGAGDEGLLAVSRDEAEALFAIADATAGANNARAFDDLFARAVGNYLLGATGRHNPDRATSLRWETETHKVDVLAALSSAFAKSSPQAAQALDPRFMIDTLRNVRTLSEDVELSHDIQNRAREAATAVAEVLTADKAGWLIDHVNQNGTMTSAGKALMSFVMREAAALDASMQPFAKVA
jgi:hypothetical protein